MSTGTMYSASTSITAKAGFTWPQVTSDGPMKMLEMGLEVNCVKLALVTELTTLNSSLWV